MDDSFEFEVLILRMMDGELLSDTQMESLKGWLNQHPDKKEELRSVSLIWNQLDSIRELDEAKVNQAWNKMHDRTFKSKGLFNKTNLLAVAKYAAVLVLGVLLTTVVYYFNNSVANKAYLSQIIEVPYGAKSTVKLPDGSEIILNAGSQISYNNNYGHKSRKVALTGEAYFKIAKNPEMPFEVNTGDMIVRAYGTTFNIKSYGDEGMTTTTLVEGSISVELPNQKNKANKELFLKPNQQLILEKQPDALLSYNLSASNSANTLKIAKNIETEVFTSWIDDKIIVKSESLEKLVVKLERKYNVKINMADEDLKQLKFTGTLENETIEQIMHVLELSSSINFKIDERQIWLSKK